MKLTNDHFEMFKGYCLEYQEKFNLKHVTLYFKFEKIDGGAYADCESDKMYVATIRLNKGSIDPKDHGGDVDTFLRETARHEMVHAVTGRVYQIASDRWASKDQLFTAEEEVCKLIENIIAAYERGAI